MMKRSKSRAIPARSLRSGQGRPLAAARGTAPARPAARPHFTGEDAEALQGRPGAEPGEGPLRGAQRSGGSRFPL